jgi:hypothetical protein
MESSEIVMLEALRKGIETQHGCAQLIQACGCIGLYCARLDYQSTLLVVQYSATMAMASSAMFVGEELHQAYLKFKEELKHKGAEEDLEVSTEVSSSEDSGMGPIL